MITLHNVPEIDDRHRYMDLMHNETSLDFCHKTLLAYCKRSIIETDSFERKDNECKLQVVLKSSRNDSK